MRNPLILCALTAALVGCIADPEEKTEYLGRWQTSQTNCQGCADFAIEIAEVKGEWPDYARTGKTLRLDYWRADLISMYDEDFRLYRRGDCYYTAANRACFHPEAGK